MFPVPTSAADRPDLLDHGEQECGGQPEQHHAVERLQRAHGLPLTLQEDAGVAVAGDGSSAE